MRDLGIGDSLDGYRIEALVAHGGMATVFKAVDPVSGEPVALKIPLLRYESDVVFFERFRREEEASLRLDHPCVVRALPPRGEKSRMYMVMEYVQGVPLSSLLSPGRPLPVEQALDVARQTCDALAYLHAHGVVHRDIKPGNVLLTPNGQVKILDLGLAHVDSARRLGISFLTASSGTPAYMAPEQIRGGRTGDARVDVYALGTMLYEMLTGRLPYSAADWDALLRVKRLEPPTPPTAHAPGLDPALEAIVMRAIEPDPRDRYATAVDLLADLRDPPAALRRGPAPRTAPRRRIDGTRLAAFAVIAATLCGLGGVAWFSYRRVRETLAETAASGAGGVSARPPGREAGSPRPAP